MPAHLAAAFAEQQGKPDDENSLASSDSHSTLASSDGDDWSLQESVCSREEQSMLDLVHDLSSVLGFQKSETYLHYFANDDSNDAELEAEEVVATDGTDGKAEEPAFASNSEALQAFLGGRKFPSAPNLHGSSSFSQFVCDGGSGDNDEDNAPVISEPKAKPMVQRASTGFLACSDHCEDAKDRSVEASPSPQDVLTEILVGQGVAARSVSYESEALDGFFHAMNADNVTGYDMAITTAVSRSRSSRARVSIVIPSCIHPPTPFPSPDTQIRQDDFETVKKYHAQGAPLDCCNKFHETLIHLAARRQQADTLQFLIHQAGVSPNVVCDGGRTPLHDACWTSRPSFEAVRVLLEASPDLLFISDNRGLIPFAYIPRDKWGEWNDFLQANRELLKPRVLID